MKTAIWALFFAVYVAVASSSACAQGTVNFITFNVNTQSGQVFVFGNTPGTNYVGQLWWSDTGASNSFLPAGTPQPFGSNSTYINNGSVVIPRPAGTTVFIQMRVWHQSAGLDWCSAVADSIPYTNPPHVTITQTRSRILGGIDSAGDPVSPQQYNNFPNADFCLCPVGPPPCPPKIISSTKSGDELILSWTGPFILQSATNVTGIYGDIWAVGSPYTNITTSAEQQFFRLRN